MKHPTRPNGSNLLLTERDHQLEKAFLTGRRGRAEDLESAVRIFLEFLRGFESLTIKRPAVTVFGSARFSPDHPYCKLGQEVGHCLARSGFPVKRWMPGRSWIATHKSSARVRASWDASIPP